MGLFFNGPRPAVRRPPMRRAPPKRRPPVPKDREVIMFCYRCRRRWKAKVRRFNPGGDKGDRCPYCNAQNR